jgi:hypothetical protein
LPPQDGSINVALDKATSAALYRRPTAAFAAGLKAGNNYLLQLRGANAVPGGLPIVSGANLSAASAPAAAPGRKIPRYRKPASPRSNSIAAARRIPAGTFPAGFSGAFAVTRNI